MNNDAFDSLQYAMKTLQKTASTTGLSFEEVADAMRSLARMGGEIRNLSTKEHEETLKTQYKTLNYKYEIL